MTKLRCFAAIKRERVYEAWCHSVVPTCELIPQGVASDGFTAKFMTHWDDILLPLVETSAGRER